MRGIDNVKPSLPRYTAMWDVKIVLDYLGKLDLSDIALPALSQKLATMVMLYSGQRLWTLATIEREDIVIMHVDSVEIKLAA